MPPTSLPPRASQPVPGLWLRTLHQWHWVSSALSLVCMAFFAFTGITLNHAAQIEARPVVRTQAGVLPPSLLTGLQVELARAQGDRPLPEPLQAWLRAQWSVESGGRPAEWAPDEVYLALPRPGGDAWVRIDMVTGEVEHERTDRGWISWLNDLHKGRHTGEAWRWFIDLFAAACLVFTLTGLLILKVHALKRPFTWPMVGLGFLIPALLTLLFIH